jgi:regulator of cell morphogenesis and NO signaling
MTLTESQRRDDAQRAAAPSEGIAAHEQPLRAIIAHIVATHHVFTRETTARIESLIPEALAADASEHPELLQITRVARALCDDLGPHLLREERVLFPWIEAAEAAKDRGAAPPPAHFGTVKNPVRVMDGDHHAVRSLLEALRVQTSSYTAPSWASDALGALYDALGALDRDLQAHMHIESDILFVRAIALESAR